MTPWTAACQGSLSITNCWSLLKLMSIKLVMLPILCHPRLCLNYQKFSCGCPARRGEAYCTSHWQRQATGPRNQSRASTFLSLALLTPTRSLRSLRNDYSSEATNSASQTPCFLQLIFFSLLRSYATVVFFSIPRNLKLCIETQEISS